MSGGVVHTGSCLCGAVHLSIRQKLRGIHACHCSQCRKQTGHFAVAGSAPREAITIEGADQLSWFASSPGIRRGFCRTCGAHMIWDDPAWSELSINLGCLDAPTDLVLESHIYCADKGDYYPISDDLPQYPGAEENDG
ncbi:MAG: GFA family protein [Pseudomonadota bacterium]